MRPIAVFYHMMTERRGPAIFVEQMKTLKASGLDKQASLIVIGVNGGKGTIPFVQQHAPATAEIVQHGPLCQTENLTILEVEKFIKESNGSDVLYFHTKGASKIGKDGMVSVCDRWRGCMMRNLVTQWQRCVEDLRTGLDSVGCHWYQGTHYQGKYWAGNFWWATSEYLSTLPPMSDRPQIKQAGFGSIKSRYEAEVWITRGRVKPKVKDYHAGFNFNCK